MRIFAGVPQFCQTTVMHWLRPSVLRRALSYLSPIATPTGPFRQSSIRRYFCGRQDVNVNYDVSLDEKMKRVIF